MLTLCKLYGVDEKNYLQKSKNTENAEVNFTREIDFYLVNEKEYKCEVKLMGKGNPESADAVFARDSDVFVADKLSDTNKNQLNSSNIRWVELRSENGFHKFEQILDDLEISHGTLPEPLDTRLQEIFGEIFE
jgi:hypothetical protein